MTKNRVSGRFASGIRGAVLWIVACGPAAAQPSGYELALVDFEGNRNVLTVLPGNVFAPRISPDGSRVVYETVDVSDDGAAARLWVADLDDLDAPRSFPVVGGPINWAPIWTADGERLVFVVSGGRPDALYLRSADGTGEAVWLTDGRAAEVQIPGSSRLTFLTLAAGDDYGISVLDVESGDTATLIHRPGSAQHSGNVSPDGRWIAYASNETGRYEVWLEPLPPSGERRRVTRNGGAHPMWASDGAAIFFDRDHRLFRVDVATAEMSIGEEVPLPITGFEQGEYRRQFDLMPDGTRFLVMFAVE